MWGSREETVREDILPTVSDMVRLGEGGQTGSGRRLEGNDKLTARCQSGKKLSLGFLSSLVQILQQHEGSRYGPTLVRNLI